MLGCMYVTITVEQTSNVFGVLEKFKEMFLADWQKGGTVTPSMEEPDSALLNFLNFNSSAISASTSIESLFDHHSIPCYCQQCSLDIGFSNALLGLVSGVYVKWMRQNILIG